MSIDPVTLGNHGVNVDALTPDALLVYIQSALGDLDADIQGYLDKQKQILAEKTALHDVEALLGTKPKSSDELLELYRKAEAEIRKLPEGDPVRSQAHALLVQFVQDHREHGGRFDTTNGVVTDPEHVKFKTVADDQWKKLDEDLKNIGEDTSSQGETNMIQLQSLMSRRQTAVQLTTNVMNKLDQSYESIVKNI